MGFDVLANCLIACPFVDIVQPNLFPGAGCVGDRFLAAFCVCSPASLSASDSNDTTWLTLLSSVYSFFEKNLGGTTTADNFEVIFGGEAAAGVTTKPINAFCALIDTVKVIAMIVASAIRALCAMTISRLFFHHIVCLNIGMLKSSAGVWVRR